MSFPLPHAARASALIAVYWAIAILSFAAFTTASVLFSDLDQRANARQAVAASALAGKGLALASHPLVEPDDPLLRPDGASWMGAVEREQARLNLNRLLASADRATLRELFLVWGLPEAQVEPLIDALIDWYDPDDQVTGNGAERFDYLERGIEGAPRNGPFPSLEEAAQVRGMSLLARVNPDWKEAFTVWGGGKLDLDDAGPETIHAVSRCGMDAARRFVQARRGRDGLENTRDDMRFDTLEVALLQLGVAPDAPVAGRFTVGSTLLRLRGIGSAGEVRMERWAVVRERSPRPRLLDYGERRL